MSDTFELPGYDGKKRATYDSICPKCRERIDEGEWIYRLPQNDGWTWWVCGDCGSEADTDDERAMRALGDR